MTEMSPCRRYDGSLPVGIPNARGERRRINEAGGGRTLGVAKLLTDPKTIPHLMKCLAGTRIFTKPLDHDTAECYSSSFPE
ncbi:unnamed protein product [Mycena citricolor]|uniref:Uncharacterized protein n=1 Tax=Mycena citricolor TaxID=2018698 RepID=A0AAD2HZD6_9AGAR|nr:unnamed protein product [Mycena citricolor]CAK5282245.1 unnamed protein product [Mycena citricolor]CAK5284044.1 unnamed protein product [Mycena citricolor]